jgi:hypothetical protein
MKKNPNVLHRDLVNGRWYFPDKYKEDTSKWCPSVTTILNVLSKPGLDDWKTKMGQYHKIYSSALAFRGTIVHHFCERLVYGDKVTKDDINLYIYNSNEHRWKMEFTQDQLNYSCRQMIKGFVKFWEEKNPTALAVEYPLYHESIPYAGRGDLVLELNDKKGVKIRVLMDIKTGFENPQYTLQNSAYKKIWDTLFPRETITHVGNLYLNDRFRTERGVYKVKITKPNIEAFEDCYDLWKWNNTPMNKTHPIPKLKNPPPELFELKKEKEDGVSKATAKTTTTV